MKKSMEMDRDRADFAFAQFEDWVEESPRKMLKRPKKERSFIDEGSECGRGKVMPVSRRSKHRLYAS